MKITKILAVLLAVIMLICAVACSNQTPPASDNGNENNGENNGENNEENNGENNGENGGENQPPAPADKVVSLGEFLDAMASSVYKLTDTVTEAKIGLADSKNVGVDKQRFENEILYPVPADSEFAHIYKVSEHDISVNNENNSLALNSLLKSLKDVEGLKKIEFEPGVYKFKSTLIFEDLEDLYFCSSDPTKNFEILMTTWVQGISVTGCDNIHFNNYDLDYETSPTVAGEIVAYDEKTYTVTVKIYDEFDLTQSEYGNKNLGALTNGWGSYIEFKLDEATGEYVPNADKNIRTGSEITNSSYDAATKTMSIVLDKNAKAPVIGDPASIAFTMYNHFGFNGGDCGKVYIESVNIYTTGGMAFGLHNSEGFYVNRIKLDLRKGSKRLMTATADGFHTSDVREIKVTNCVFQYSHDDSFNIKNSYVTVAGAAAKKVNVQASPAYVVEVGDEVEFFEESTMTSFGKYTVTKVESSGSSFSIQLNKMVDDNIKGALMANNTKATKLTLDNNVIGNKRNRGILFQSRESTITNNVFKNIVHGAVQIFTVRNEFKEGICPANVLVANNKFMGNYSGDMSIFSWGSLGPYNGGIAVGLIEGIEVTNNFFANCPTTSLSVSACSDSSVSNNLFYNTSLGENVMFGMTVDYSSDLEIKNNYFYSDVKTRMTPLDIGSHCGDNITKKTNKFEKID